MIITTPEQMQAAIDAKRNPSLVAYRRQVERVLIKVRREEPLSDGERYFVCSILEGAAGVFNSAAFYLAQFVEPHVQRENEE